MYLKNIESPVILSFSHTPMSIAKTSARKLNYTDIYRSIFKLDGNESRLVTDDELKLMKVASLVCVENFSEDIFKLFPNDNYADKSIISTIHDMAPTYSDTMINCNVFNNMAQCHDYFFPSITDDGLCYTFNMFNTKDFVTDNLSSDLLDVLYNISPMANWKMESGYDESHVKPYPMRVFGTGKQFCVGVLLRIFNSDSDPLAVVKKIANYAQTVTLLAPRWNSV
ncbi:uncharacterized protein LOC116338358 [Contarinia nasturtii]|uniref:uncharacterized protein LOC116338358 n=1 Tax=Contarinia nasturtii TaxID=265458 RepID=UPI0012D3E8F9|nr:uncharacterized protein LOC116338358 [Contarinia nasturtii]